VSARTMPSDDVAPRTGDLPIVPDTGDLPIGPDKTAMVRAMFDAIAPRYDLVNRVMTFGLDISWRRRAVRALGLPARSRVVDVACGTGDFLRILDAAGMRAVGVDLSWGMLRAASRPGALAQADALRLPLGDDSFDGATCGFALRNVSDLGAMVAELARVVRPGGRIALVEVDEPRGPVMRTGHRIWFRHGVPRVGALLSDAAAYRYLPRSVAYLPSPTQMRALLRDAGFAVVGRRSLGGGVAQLLTATRAGVPTRGPR